MSDVDWTVIFERINLVDGVLANGCGFGEMDFPTRNMYRTAIEELARGSNLSELRLHAVRFRPEFRPPPTLRKTTGDERIRVITFAAADASSSRPQSAFGQGLN